MNEEKLVYLSSLSDTFHILEHTTRKKCCYEVAEFIVETLLHTKTIQNFCRSIHDKDNEVSKTSLEEVFSHIKPRWDSFETILDDINAVFTTQAKKDESCTLHDLSQSLLELDLEVLRKIPLCRREQAFLSSQLERLEDPIGWSRYHTSDENYPFTLKKPITTSEEKYFVARQLAKTKFTQNVWLKPMNSPIQQSGTSDVDYDEDMEEYEIQYSVYVPYFLRRETTNEETMGTGLQYNLLSTFSNIPDGCFARLIDFQKEYYKGRREICGLKEAIKLQPHPTTSTSRLLTNINKRTNHKTRKALIKEQRTSLKIFYKKQELIDALATHDVIILIGETGSGKTTQIPQYLAEAGYASTNAMRTDRNSSRRTHPNTPQHIENLSTKRLIGCTQPRRLPTRSVAERVATEYGCVLGEEIGYTIRFEDKTSSRTIIKYMTDGILLRKALSDPTFSQYGVLIIDEAHERSINTDVLLGLLKRAIALRTFKLIVTSATLNVEKFSAFFDNAFIFRVSGRSFPVDLVYLDEPFPSNSSYVFECVKKVITIHLEEEAGDILVFLPGKEEIEDAYSKLQRWGLSLPAAFPKMQIHMVYAALPTEVQAQVFLEAPTNTRKVVLATNVAETSVTIDGIRFVVDSGIFKEKIFRPSTGMEILRVIPISQAQAKQRAGRSGRTSTGKCYRMYTETMFKEEMPSESTPEVQRSNLSNVVLTMKASGVMNILAFDFIDPPSRPILVDALNRLYALGALDDDGLLTPFGRRMSHYPLDPSLSAVLLFSHALGCSEAVITILSILSSDEIFYRPKDQVDKADSCRTRLQRRDGDHMSLLSIYMSWAEKNYDQKWCAKNYINYRTLLYARDVRRELCRMMEKQGFQLNSKAYKSLDLSLSARVRKAFTAGFFVNVARHTPEGYRKLSDRSTVYLYPNSSMLGSSTPWVIFHTLTMTSREYMREVSPIDVRWLPQLAPRYFRKLSKDELLQMRKHERLDPLFRKNLGPDEWRFSNYYRKHRKHR